MFRTTIKEKKMFLNDSICRVKNILYRANDQELISLAEGYFPDITSDKIFENKLINDLLKESVDNRNTERIKIKKDIIDFIEEQDSWWVDKKKMNFLEKEMRKDLKFIENYENLAKKTFLIRECDPIYRKTKANYKRKYIDYATLKGQRAKEDNFIDDVEIERLRQIPIENINPNSMKSGGKNRMFGKCPFHNENTPSFWVFEGNSYYCFGCNVSGQNAIDFIMKLNNITFKEAIDKLKYY